jgi:hypothetical protein
VTVPIPPFWEPRTRPASYDDDPCDEWSWWTIHAYAPVPPLMTDHEAQNALELFHDLRQQQRLRFEWWEIPLFVVCAMAIGAVVFSAWRAAVGS